MTRHPRSQDRAALEGEAGELYRFIVADGPVSTADPQVAGREEAVDILLALGLVVRDRQCLVAVDPALVQSRIVGPLGQQAAQLQAESAAWATTLTELAQDFRRTSPTDSSIHHIHGLANINRFLESAVGDAREELLTAQPAGARKASTLESALKRDVAALERGVAMRTLYQHSARRSKATRDYVARITKVGAQVRTLDEFFNRLILVDRRLAVLPGAKASQQAIAVHEPSMVAFLADIFERNWERATAFGDRQPRTERAIADDVHNMTLRMLAEGYSDQASAKRMGVSMRSYASYVSALKLSLIHI